MSEVSKIKNVRRLKNLESSDMLPLVSEQGEYLLVTRQEVTKIICGYIDSNVSDVKDRYLAAELAKIQQYTKTRLTTLEDEVGKYIDYKFAEVVERMCEKLMTRKIDEVLSRQIEEEVEKRVAEKLEKIRLAKSKKGFI